MARNILNTLSKLASMSDDYKPTVRGVTVLGKEFDEPGKFAGYRETSAANTSRRGRFTSPSAGNIASSSRQRMSKPSARDGDTAKKWSGFERWH